MFLVITAWLGCQPDDATPAPASPEPCRAVDGPLAFTAAPALPGPSEGGALVAIGNRLVVAGGFDGESVVDTV